MIIKKISKIVVFIVIFLSLVSICNVSQALSWQEIFKGGDNFLREGETGATSGNVVANDVNVMEIMNDLYSILFPLGVVATVIVGGILGIKFMLASAEDKAKVKESMMPYVIGCIVIYGAFGIWKICIELFSTIF